MPRTSTATRRPWLDSLGRAGECLLLGACWFLFALPVVTAFAAPAAALVVVDGWARGEEPPLIRTFTAGLGRRTLRSLAPGGAFLGTVALLLLDARLAAAGLPGGRVVEAGSLLLGAALIGCTAIAAVVHTIHGGDWWPCWRRALRDCARRPALLPAVTATLAVAAVLVAVFPVLALLAAGPVVLAVYALYATHR
jgi:hypothetical protein